MFRKKRTSSPGLSVQLILIFVITIVTTIIIAGISSYWSLQSELDHQARERVSSGVRVSQTLIGAEKERINNLANHAAQRPTLQRLIYENNQEALTNYLQTFISGVDLDFIVISNGLGIPIAANIPINLPLDITKSTSIGFYISKENNDKLGLTATQTIPGETNEDTAFVSVGIYLDDIFAMQIAAESGFEQSFLIANKQVASSLPGVPVDRKDIDQASYELGYINTIKLGDSRYYVTQIPLYDHQDNIVAIEEVALSVDSLKAAKRHTMLILGICTLVIAGAGAFLGSIIAGRLIEPLQKLTDSVINISQGDLDTPIPIPESPNEISTLAIALDNSRCNTLSIIDNLSRSNSWWKTLIRSIPDGIITIDNQERITAFNSGAEVITGWKSDEAMRLGINRVLQIPEREAGFTGNIQIGGGPQQICILNRKGQEVILSVTGSRTERTDENISQTTYVLRDITEEEIAQRLRSHFLRNITKEFQTPLIVLNTSIERLMGEIRDLSRSEIFDLLNSIHFNVSGLQGLIDNLFESTNVIAEFSQLHRRPTDLRDIVTEAARIIQPLLNRRNQTLSQDIGKDLPLVNVDQNRLSQALVNLLLNASKFSPAQGKITLIVNIKDNQSLYIAVQDQGAGISPTDRPNLFRPFVGLGDLDDSEYQVQLGLSVVRSIVEKHGGELGVDPRDGEGSTFWINIPLD